MKVEITKNGALEITQGWTFKPIIEFSEDEILAIDKVYFVCKDLGICQEMTRDVNEFYMQIEPAVTSTYPKKTTSYNLEIEFNETPLVIGGFNSGILEVIENKNPKTC